MPRQVTYRVTAHDVFTAERLGRAEAYAEFHGEHFRVWEAERQEYVGDERWVWAVRIHVGSDAQ